MIVCSGLHHFPYLGTKKAENQWVLLWMISSDRCASDKMRDTSWETRNGTKFSFHHSGLNLGVLYTLLPILPYVFPCVMMHCKRFICLQKEPLNIEERQHSQSQSDEDLLGHNVIVSNITRPRCRCSKTMFLMPTNQENQSQQMPHWVLFHKNVEYLHGEAQARYVNFYDGSRTCIEN